MEGNNVLCPRPATHVLPTHHLCCRSLPSSQATFSPSLVCSKSRSLIRPNITGYSRHRQQLAFCAQNQNLADIPHLFHG